MRAIIPQNQWQELLSETSYRGFVKKLMSLRSCQGRKFGYSDIARGGGFVARSYPRDVVNGQRRLTPASILKFTKGLGLTGEWAEYFRLLVELEQPDCRTRLVDDDKIQRLLQNLRKRLLQKSGPTLDQTEKGSIYQIHAVPTVYAALGSKTKGADVSEIRKRTGLDPEVIRPILDQLIQANIVEKRQHRYFVREHHLNLVGLGSSEIFKAFYLHLLQQAAISAKTKFKSDEQLYFSSSLSVNSKDLPRLKDELRAVLLGFADAAEHSDGDKVVSLATAFF